MLVGPAITKEPAEIIPWSVDIAPILKSGETVSGLPIFKSHELTAKLKDGGAFSADATSAMKEGAVAPDGTVYTQMVKAGTHAKAYVLELEFTTSLGQKRQAEIELWVDKIPVNEP